MDKFTPGPWLCVGRIVYALNDRGYNSFHCGVQDSFTPESELIANAQLIAAAPDLLAALNNILVGMEASGGWAGDDALFEEGMAAYNKATKDAK